MRLASVGFLLMAILLIYSILLFFVVGILGHLTGSLIGYYKFGHWFFGWEEIRKSILVGLSCGIPVSLGIWIKSKVAEHKENLDD